ncbi:uncharacterized protein KQ657_001872 [Scheffersomyces spartinae]|uniref:Extradiol ring-cleavage dioxygenase class III enzyme subunit B domain-containing protein n=1 Tax=Scheffersomyces spartinae TaxID=45513 RepID=A0A9P7V7S6_9ASCO|nr:uncharacterized protein KQ657_001872 [Scheffersomyces spartinae]KAG7192471.1 hypothetical protein KQ657_001872 [Scheffersomyces spartinae]
MSSARAVYDSDRTQPFKVNPSPFPTYFFSHGGPNFIYDDHKGAWKTVKKLGTNIKNNWKPDYVLVVSAHWQSTGRNLIEISTPPPTKNTIENPLIYDFYGFPSHMYREEFHTKNDAFVAQSVKDHLIKNGFNSTLSNRGIDHGLWCPLKVAFTDYTTLKSGHPPAEGEFDVDFPVIQVSLTGSDSDFDNHYKLGKALNQFRENLIWDPTKKRYLKGALIMSGMSVHNLRDLGWMFANPGKSLPYTSKFNTLLTNTLTTSQHLLESLNDIKKDNRLLLHSAHPTLEHFLPIVVGAGTVDDSKAIKELYNENDGSLGWGIYQFGSDYTTSTSQRQ